MNHCYRLIWNRLRQCFVVAAEITRGGGKSGGKHCPVLAGRVWLLVWPLALVPLLGMATGAGAVVAQPVTHALVAPGTTPVGGMVTAGTGAIRQNGLTTTISQHSQNLSLNWQSFNVGAASTVNFAQPNAQSIAVNRIAGSNGSVILGHLNANGQVFLINPNGVLFGPSAQVNVGGLVASTLAMGDGELAGGTRHFLGGGRGSVINQGSLGANEGGYIALLGPQVTNQGTLSAPGGTVAMGGGNAITLSFDANRLLSLQVDQSTLNALADNRQLIMADGGQVLMSAGAKDALLSSVVNNSGVIQAQTVANRDGRIVLLGGMAAGTAQVAGRLDASAPTSGDGGFIETSAAHVTVADAAKVTTQAAVGSTGTWLIDPQEYTIAATGGDMTGATLSANLGTSAIAILSSGGTATGSGNINLNDSVSWSTNTKLTLTASNDVDINANITATGASAGLVLAPNTANGADAASGSGQYRLANGAVITLSGATPSLRIAGTPYTVINSLGTATSTTGTDLQGMNGNLAGNYALGSDIDASTTSAWRSGQGLTAIGTDTNRFQGVFDGLGHTITGLNGANFFGTTAAGSSIRNVGLLARNAVGVRSFGGLVSNNHGMIDQTFVNGNVTGTGSYVGGLVYYNNGTINRSHVDGVVSGLQTLGGLVSTNDALGMISQSYATAAVTGTVSVGGLVGLNNGKIIQSYATGAVSGDVKVGGLAGTIQGTSTVTQTWASGAVTGTTQTGGFVGYSNNSAIASYWDSYSTGWSTGAGAGGTAGITAVTSNPTQSAAANYAFKQSAYTNLSFTPGGGGWFMVDGSTRPFLQSEYSTNIGNVHQLQLAAMYLAAAYTLASNLDASETARAVNSATPAAAAGMWSNAGFSPLGPSISNPFKGDFDGLGHAITGLTIKRSTDRVGLFGASGAGSSIQNIGLLGGSVTGGNFTGGLVGYSTSAQINQAYVTGAVKGRSYTGGLVGYNASGTIGNAYATGAVSGSSSVGGLVGYSANSGSPNHVNIGQVYASGAVTGGSQTGGLVGYNASGVINQGYATGTVTGTTWVGGLVGFNSGGINQAYASGAVSGNNSLGGLAGYNSGTINQAYATGVISGAVALGGLVGTDGSGTVTSSYWNTQASGQVISAGGTGLTSAQMQDPTSFVGWDLASTGGSSAVWRIYLGQTAPLLRPFMTGLSATANNATVTYNSTAFAGSTYTLGAVTPSYWLPSTTVNPALVSGTVNTAAPTTNAGTYTAALNSGLYSSQMGYDITLTPGTLIVNQAPLGIAGAVAANKVYDGTTTASISGATLSGTIYATDAVTLGNATAGTFANKNAATGKTATMAATLSGAAAANYKLTQPTGLTATITPASLTVSGITAADKTYDGATSATLGYGSVSFTGIVGADSLTASGAVGTFSDKNVGTGKSVGIAGITVGGADAGNYSLTGTTASASASISAATLTYAAAGASTTYGTPATGLTGTLSGFVGGDTASNATTGTAAFATTATATSNVGSYAINGGGLTATSGNYTFAQAPGNAAALTINPAALTISTGDVSKVYDGTTIALGKPMATVGTLFGTDSLSGGTYAFDTKDVGANKTVSVAAVSVNDGNSGANYDVTYIPNTHSSIGAKPIVLLPIAKVSGIGSDNKVYDGTIQATLDFGNAVFNGMAKDDRLAVGSAMGVFSDKNAGIGKIVFISGITLGGADASNYTLLDTTARTTANITPLGIMVTASGGTKVYDGTTGANVALTSTGVFTGDSVNFTANSQFVDRNVGTAKQVTVDSISATGADAGNYRSNTSDSTTADITPATLIYLAKSKSAVTGGVPSGLTGTVTGLVGSDTVATSTTGTLSWSTPATASSPVGQYAIDGAGLGATNYLFQQAPGNASALQLTAGIESMTATPQEVATIVAQLQQAPQSASGNTLRDDIDPETSSFATSRSPTTGLPAPRVRIVDGGVRMP